MRPSYYCRGRMRSRCVASRASSKPATPPLETSDAKIKTVTAEKTSLPWMERCVEALRFGDTQVSVECDPAAGFPQPPLPVTAPLSCLPLEYVVVVCTKIVWRVASFRPLFSLQVRRRRFFRGNASAATSFLFAPVRRYSCSRKVL